MTDLVEVGTPDLSGEALNWAVGKAEGLDVLLASPVYGNPWRVFVRYTGEVTIREVRYAPSELWEVAGPLISKQRVSIIYSDEVCDPCAWTDATAAWHAETPLIAACRAIVAAKLGDTVQVPKELI